MLLEELWVLVGLEEEKGLYGEEITRKATMVNDLERTTLLEAMSWRQNRGRFGYARLTSA